MLRQYLPSLICGWIPPMIASIIFILLLRWITKPLFWLYIVLLHLLLIFGILACENCFRIQLPSMPCTIFFKNLIQFTKIRIFLLAISFKIVVTFNCLAVRDFGDRSFRLKFLIIAAICICLNITLQLFTWYSFKRIKMGIVLIEEGSR